MNLTDRDILIGLTEAIGALAERLAGQELEIKLIDSAGDFIWVRPDVGEVRWAAAVVPQARPDARAKSPPTPTAFRTVRCESQQASGQSSLR
jgi:hypothetical protein